MNRRLVLATVFFLFCPALWAQNAELSGLVKDPSEAVVPGALVKVTNVNTAQERKTETNNEGLYTLPSLPPGKYEVQVSKAGFQTLIRSNLTLEVAQRVRVDFTLQVGSAAQSVTVTAGGPNLNTTDASVSTVTKAWEGPQSTLRDSATARSRRFWNCWPPTRKFNDNACAEVFLAPAHSDAIAGSRQG